MSKCPKQTTAGNYHREHPYHSIATPEPGNVPRIPRLKSLIGKVKLSDLMSKPWPSRLLTSASKLRSYSTGVLQGRPNYSSAPAEPWSMVCVVDPVISPYITTVRYGLMAYLWSGNESMLPINGLRHVIREPVVCAGDLILPRTFRPTV